MPVNLNYGPTKEIPGLGSLFKDNWYRYHGNAGLEDFNRTGLIRANPSGKWSSSPAYFSQGELQSRYARHGGDVIVEALKDAVDKTENYTEASPYGTKNLRAGKDRFRVLKKLNDVYEPVYDNLSAHKYYGRKLLGMSPLIAGLEALFYSPEVGVGSDIIGNN